LLEDGIVGQASFQGDRLVFRAARQLTHMCRVAAGAPVDRLRRLLQALIFSTRPPAVRQ